MGANTNIEWATHTLNWWTGCEPISPACAHCYAAAWAKRAGRDFAERRLTTEANRRQAFKWEKNAPAFEAEHGHRQRIFVNSLADVFDNQVPQTWRDELFATIRDTPSLDYLLLTKRIGNAKKMLPADWGDGYPNVWLGSTVVTQEEADRDIPKLLATPAAIRFLSCEPLLGPVDITEWLWGFENPCATCPRDIDCECGWNTRKENKLPSIDLVICGGESGSNARPMDIRWADDLRQQCADASTAFFMKQLGGVRDKRGDLADMPESLRVREFPR